MSNVRIADDVLPKLKEQQKAEKVEGQRKKSIEVMVNDILRKDLKY